MDQDHQQEQLTPQTHETGASAEPDNSDDRPQRSKLLVFLFSLVPGAGHMYMGVMNRGLQLMLLFFGTLFIGNLVGHPLTDFWPTVVAPVVWFYSFFDSLQTAGRLAREDTVEDKPIPFLHVAAGIKWGKTAGWILVGLGVLALVNNMGFLLPELTLWVRRLLGPAILVGIGAWLLLRERQEQNPRLPAGGDTMNTAETPSEEA